MNNVDRIYEKLKLDNIDVFLEKATESLKALKPCLYGNKERPSDLMDCGVIDGSWDTWCKILNCLRIDNNDIDLLINDEYEKFQTK